MSKHSKESMGRWESFLSILNKKWWMLLTQNQVKNLEWTRLIFVNMGLTQLWEPMTMKQCRGRLLIIYLNIIISFNKTKGTSFCSSQRLFLQQLLSLIEHFPYIWLHFLILLFSWENSSEHIKQILLEQTLPSFHVKQWKPPLFYLFQYFCKVQFEKSL